MNTPARGSKSLGLWMNGHFVGTWSLEPGGDVLQYDNEWVASPLRRPLSLSLPFTPGNRPHKGDVVRFYFENLQTARTSASAWRAATKWDLPTPTRC